MHTLIQYALIKYKYTTKNKTQTNPHAHTYISETQPLVHTSVTVHFLVKYMNTHVCHCVTKTHVHKITQDYFSKSNSALLHPNKLLFQICPLLYYAFGFKLQTHLLLCLHLALKPVVTQLQLHVTAC